MAAHIQSITFDPEGLEITYAEESEILDNGLRIFRTAIVPRSLIQDALADLEESAQTVLDQVTIIRRAPEATFKR